MDEDIKTATLTRRKEILCLIKQKTDEVLNPGKPENNPSLTQEDIFQDLDITAEQYGWALPTSPNSDYDLHLKRSLDTCFTNNYLIAGVK